MKGKKHLVLAQETLRKLTQDESRLNLNLETTLPVCPTGTATGEAPPRI